MTDRALVIGLDAYDNPNWTLNAAVRDALDFAKWVTQPGAGRAAEETLTLLLSPHPDRPVDPGLKYVEATEDAIKDALLKHKKNGADARRLWFFYAGHGMAPRGGAPDQAPLMVPKDKTDIEYLREYPIDLGAWIRSMQVCAPEYQVFFVDACRGIVVSEDVVTATRTLFFDLEKMKADVPLARQAVLFATTAGQLANEQGLHGLFSGALLKGLRGDGPELVTDVENQNFVLTFDRLFAFTKRRIEVQALEARRANKTLPTQTPEQSYFRESGSLELARFAEKPRSPVRIYVKPAEARKVGTAAILSYNDFDGWVRTAPRGPELDEPVEWRLSAAKYKIRIEATGFSKWDECVEVAGPKELSVQLSPGAFPASPETPLNQPASGLESLRLPPVGAGEPGPTPSGDGLGQGKFGELNVEAPDRYTRIEVFDTAGRREAAAWGSVNLKLKAGSWRVETALPTERPAVRWVIVTADDPANIHLHPDPQFTKRLPETADIVGPREGFSMPSEMFGLVTTTHVGSLLAWAAFAAQFPVDGDGRKLRDLGIRRLPSAGCFVRVLIGDASEVDDRQAFASAVIEIDRKPLALEPVPALAGMAIQGDAALQFHASVFVRFAGLEPKRIPTPFMPGHVWTIVIARELTGLTEIHRYLQRLEPQGRFDDTIRLVELNWRALAEREALFNDEAEKLLGRDLDPLSLAVLGYRLARESRWPELQNLIDRLLPSGLADAHVLAALLGQRDANMELALKSPSVPVVGEGYRLLEDWLFEHFASLNLPPPVPVEPFAGGLWTAFDPRGQAVVSKAFAVRDAPSWAAALLPAAEATARVEYSGDSAISGSGFLIGPRALATVDFLAKQGPEIAIFDKKRVSLGAVLGVDHRHGAVIEIEDWNGPAPLKPRWTLPAVGTRIAVIGHPQITFRPTTVTLAAFKTYPTGDKMIMPGVIVAVTETDLTYECWTMAGVAGGPIVDLATAEVIGIHYGGKFEGGAKKLGFGVTLKALEEMLKKAI